MGSTTCCFYDRVKPAAEFLWPWASAHGMWLKGNAVKHFRSHIQARSASESVRTSPKTHSLASCLYGHDSCHRKCFTALPERATSTPVPCRRYAASSKDLFLGFRGLTPTARRILPRASVGHHTGRICSPCQHLRCFKNESKHAGNSLKLLTLADLRTARPPLAAIESWQMGQLLQLLLPAVVVFDKGAAGAGKVAANARVGE